MSIEDERNTEQMVRYHREALNGLVRKVRGYSRWDEQLQREVEVRKDSIGPDHDARRRYMAKLTREMQSRLDPSVKPRQSDPLAEALKDDRATKAAADLALSDWRARQRQNPRAEPTTAEANAIRAGERL